MWDVETVRDLENVLILHCHARQSANDSVSRAGGGFSVLIWLTGSNEKESRLSTQFAGRMLFAGWFPKSASTAPFRGLPQATGSAGGHDLETTISAGFFFRKGRESKIHRLPLILLQAATLK